MNGFEFHIRGDVMNKLLCTNYLNTLLILLFFSLAACGGGGNGASPSATVLQGKLVDSAVQGITYTSGSQTGVTDATGSFSYEKGKTVTFSIGDIVIGTIGGSAIITPVQFVSGATDQTNSTVTNIVQFLMTIDDDHNPANGIQITQAIRDAAAGLSVDFTLANFDTDSNVSSVVNTLTTASTIGSQVLVSNSAAQTHLSDSLFSLISGTYSGTYSGTDSGSWTITIATNGAISGTGSSNSGAPLIFTGSIQTSGTVSATTSGGVSSGSTWSGTIDITSGDVTGTWVLASIGQSGTYTGHKN